jgi:hypothetical protein
MSRNHAERAIASRTCWLGEEIAELSLLLPGWQAAEMERLAHSQGLTLGQLLRLLIRNYLQDRGSPGPVSSRQESGGVVVWRSVSVNSPEDTRKRDDL